MFAQEGNRIGDLDLDVKISGYVRESYSYEVVKGEMVKHSTVGRRERGKRNRGLLYRNTMELGPGPGDDDIGALSWDDKKKKGKGKASIPRGNKCFNCGEEGHGIKRTR